MITSNLSVRIGGQRSFGMDIDHRRVRSPRVLGGLSVLLGLLVVGGAGAKPARIRRQARPL